MTSMVAMRMTLACLMENLEDASKYLCPRRPHAAYHPFVDFKSVVNGRKNAGYDGILCVELDYQPVCSYRSAQISREYLHNVLGF